MIKIPTVDASAVTAAVATLAAATPAEIDTALYPILGRLAKAEHTLARIEKAIAKVASGARGYYAEDLPNYEARAAAARELIEQADREAAPLRAVFAARGGWTRAFKVTNAGGHVHRSTACSTCFITTEFAALPQVSGMSEADIVELAGEGACTVCYPSAPVDVLRKPCRLFTPEEREAKAARDAEKAARAAEKAIKGITDAETGGELRTKGHGVIKTERTAQIEYVNSACEAQMWERKVRNVQSARQGGGTGVSDERMTFCEANARDYRADAEKVLAALAAKRGTTVEEQRAALAKKVEAKYRRDYSWR